VQEALAEQTWQQIDRAERAGINPSQFSGFLRRRDDRGLSTAGLDVLNQVLDAGPPTGRPSMPRALAQNCTTAGLRFRRLWPVAHGGASREPDPPAAALARPDSELFE
jgi:hypothetical protein